MASRHADELAAGRRFAFGRNWRRYLAAVSAERIAIAEDSLREMLQRQDLAGARFLDVGSGSGLISLAARRLGAAVHSMDYDPESVACTRELKERFQPADAGWTIEEGSVLDQGYLRSLGSFDVVYSWGVLHHTGDMWQALDNALVPLAAGGSLWVAIYNDRGPLSAFWRRIKKTYCSGLPGRLAVTAVFIPYYFFLSIGIGVFKYGNPIRHFSDYQKSRGMSVYYDWLDWLGGYPYEVAKPEDLFEFYRRRSLALTRLRTTNGSGCNELVFRKV